MEIEKKYVKYNKYGTKKLIDNNGICEECF